MRMVRMVGGPVPVRVRPEIGRLEEAGHQGLGRVERHGGWVLLTVATPN